MDFGGEDELDYEEDELLSDSFKNDSQSLNCLGNGVNEISVFPSCDEDYLQINCSEEYENFISDGQPSETITSEEVNNFISGEQPPESSDSEITTQEFTEAIVQKGEEKGKTKKQITLKGKALRAQTNHVNGFKCSNGFANGKKMKKKKSTWSLRQPSAAKKKLTSSLNLNPWLPTYDFSEGGDRMKSSDGALYSNRSFLSQPNCPKSRKAAFHLRGFIGFPKKHHLQQEHVMAHNKRFASSNSPIGIATAGCSLTQQWFQPLTSENAEFKSDDLNMNMSKNLECNVSSQYEKFKTGSLPEKNVDVVLRQNQNSLVDEPKSDLKNTFEVSHLRNTVCIPVDKFRWKYVPESSISLLGEQNYATQIGALKDDEKELVKLKKEARRKRFLQDVITKEKEPLQSHVTKDSDKCLPDDFKVLEPNLSREKFQRRESLHCPNQPGSLLDKTNLKKELLLKKQNPFDRNVEMIHCIAGTKIKREVSSWSDSLKAECAESTLSKEIKVDKQPMKSEESEVMESFPPKVPSLFVVKNEEGSRVKFVRTISKSLHELGFGKCKAGTVSERNEDPASAHGALPNEDFQEQVTHHLTGCIVKVLNIPPATTTNDILALCNTIGIVKAVFVILRDFPRSLLPRKRYRVLKSPSEWKKGKLDNLN